MPNIVQTFRTSTPNTTPPAASRQPGELWVNFPDNQLGVIDASRNPQKLLPVRFFSTSTAYVSGEFVIQGGAIYSAKSAVAAGAFTPAQWTMIGASTDLGGPYLPLSGGTMTGALALASDPITNQQAATKQYVDGRTSSGGTNFNRLDNGDMLIDQYNRGGAVAVAAGGGGYGPDRWGTIASKAKITVGRNYSVATKCPGFTNFLGVQVTGTGAAPAAADYYSSGQNIEADTVGDLMWGTANAQPVTLSFWVNSSLTGLFGACLASAGTPWRVYAFQYSIPAANTWTKIAVVIPGDTGGTATQWPNAGNGIGLGIAFDFGYGTTGQTATVNAWQTSSTASFPSGSVKLVATSNAKWGITGVKLEAGSVATPYQSEDLARKLARCQRYFIAYTESGTNNDLGCYGSAAAGTPLYEITYLPVNMRAAPTAVSVAGSYSNCSGLTFDGGYNKAAFHYVAITATGFGVCSFGTSLSAEL